MVLQNTLLRELGGLEFNNFNLSLKVIISENFFSFFLMQSCEDTCSNS